MTNNNNKMTCSNWTLRRHVFSSKFKQSRWVNFGIKASISGFKKGERYRAEDLTTKSQWISWRDTEKKLMRSSQDIHSTKKRLPDLEEKQKRRGKINISFIVVSANWSRTNLSSGESDLKIDFRINLNCGTEVAPADASYMSLVPVRWDAYLTWPATSSDGSERCRSRVTTKYDWMKDHGVYDKNEGKNAENLSVFYDLTCHIKKTWFL